MTTKLHKTGSFWTIKDGNKWAERDLMVLPILLSFQPREDGWLNRVPHWQDETALVLLFILPSGIRNPETFQFAIFKTGASDHLAKPRTARK